MFVGKHADLTAKIKRKVYDNNRKGSLEWISGRYYSGLCGSEGVFGVWRRRSRRTTPKNNLGDTFEAVTWYGDHWVDDGAIVASAKETT